MKSALTQAYEVLKHLPKNEFAKIPKDIIDIFQENQNDCDDWKYDTSKSLSEQELSREAIAILSYINLEYLLEEEKKQIMKEIYQFNDMKHEQEKRKKFGSELFFENKKHNYSYDNKTTEIAIIEKKETLLQIIKNYLLIIINRTRKKQG